MTQTTDAALSTGTLADVISRKRIVMVVGSGGVGKTTTSATLGLLAALRGRRVLVLTIDPARRLADALSVSALSHEIQKVPEERLRILAAARGETPVPGGVGPMTIAMLLYNTLRNAQKLQATTLLA